MRSSSWTRAVLCGLAGLAGIGAIEGCGKDTSPVAPLKPPAPTSPSLSFASVPDTVRPNTLQTISAAPRDSAGNAVTDTTVKWSTSDTTVLYMSTHGPNELLIAHPQDSPHIDSAVVTASWDGIVLHKQIMVVPLLQLNPVMNPTATLRAVGTTDSLSLVGFSPAPGHPLLRGLATTWTSSNPAVISISPAGALVARAPGTATLTGTLGTSSPIGDVVAQSQSVTMLVIPGYRVTEMRGVGAHPTFIGMNDNGSILAQEDTLAQRIFVAHSDGSVQYLSACTHAFNITNTERVLCQTVVADGKTRLAIWQTDSLHVLAGITDSIPQARMNDSGDVAYVTATPGTPSPCGWPACLEIWRNGAASVLATPYRPWAIKRFDPDGRLTITIMDTTSWTPQFNGAYRYDPATGWNGFTMSTEFEANFNAVNRAGIIVGGWSGYHISPTAAYWPPDGSVQIMSSGVALSINDATYVIITNDNSSVARIDGGYGSPVQGLLPDSTWTIDFADAINNANQIVAQAHSRLDGHHALIELTPTSTTSTTSTSSSAQSPAKHRAVPGRPTQKRSE